MCGAGGVEVSGITDIDGTGQLDIKKEGRAEWLIIPYSEAAPYDDQQYEIGGTLYYTVNGQNLTVPLFPDTITVTPDPRLYLNYFLEKYVKSDDALTEGKYAIEKKSLEVIIKNFLVVNCIMKFL